jgi:phosphoribosylaminoimidazolecarboxamide formyltransferase / IMP cyclohydrolase
MPRALLSVYDKTGIIEFAQALRALSFDLVSSGGTAAALATAGVEHVSVEDVTGFPEMLDGRVKTLHPAIHGGILARRDLPDHMAVIRAHSITPIDLVVCNLYPFASDPSIELIDIGGPSMVRSAAKNHEAVGVLVDPADYPAVIAELRAAQLTNKVAVLSQATRTRLARKAFAHTSAYDAAIVEWLNTRTDDSATGGFPPTIGLALEHAQTLRYGENPHQQGARYRFAGATSWWDSAVQHGGKELSYLNVYDADAAWRLVHDLGIAGSPGDSSSDASVPAVCVIKHANPCGAATADDITTAYQLAHLCDPVSAFGGIVAINRLVPLALAEQLAPIFSEVVIAPGYEPDALELLLSKKNLRVLTASSPGSSRYTFRTVDGGLVVQTPDLVTDDLAAQSSWRVVTERKPTESELRDLRVAWTVCAHVSSNAIVLGAHGQVFGIGAGQQSRVDAAQIAVRKAGERAVGGVCASDAFFPFRDGLDLVASAGVRAVISPGGSMRDDEVIAAANEHGIAMVFTGQRHFRH